MKYEKAKTQIVSLENEDVVTASKGCSESTTVGCGEWITGTWVVPGKCRAEGISPSYMGWCMGDKTTGVGEGCVEDGMGTGSHNCMRAGFGGTGQCYIIGWKSVDISENEGFDE